MTDEKKNMETSSETEKVGVYICHCGGNISDQVDVETVRKNVERIPGVVARTNMFICSDPGQEMIIDDLNKGTVDRVVVASCSPSLHEMTFRRAIARANRNPYLYEHANIREQVSWVHYGDAATDKATRLVAAAVAKAKRLKPLEPIQVEARQHVTVIGGGVAGLRAAIDLSNRGFEVMLIEKSSFLGGRVAQLDQIAPAAGRAADIVSSLSRQVLQSNSIVLHTCSTVEAFEGYIGSFKLSVKVHPTPIEDREKIERFDAANNKQGEFIPFVGFYPGPRPASPETFTVETGAIILATGFKPYTPRSGEYGYSDFEQVVTLSELIRMLSENSQNGNLLKVNGREIRSIALIHCVGSRQIPGIHPEDDSGYLNEYCSRTCCSTTLHAANIIRETYPETRVFEFYRDIRTYGRGQEALYEQASRNKVVFLRFAAEDLPEVTGNGDANDFPLLVKVRDTLTFGEEVEVPVDMVVLATGMEPNNISELVEIMKLPVGADRFLLEVHPKLRPVELATTGILLAGTCQAPMDIGEACTAASAAAVKAAALLARGQVALDPFVAEVDIEKCNGTGACVEACPYEGALNLAAIDADGQTLYRAQVNQALCTGCGACVAVCPDNAIDVNGWTLAQYKAMVDMIVADDIDA